MGTPVLSSPKPIRLPTPLPPRPTSQRPSADRMTQWAFRFYMSMVVVSVLYFILLALSL